MIQELTPHLEQLHGRLSGETEPLALTYLPQIPSSPQDDKESVAYTFRQEMAARWDQEKKRGMTLIGPHREDCSFLLGQMDLDIYGSRGQQRTATIALKLAQVEWLRVQSGETPVVLLDDVLSELDPERQRYLQMWLLEGDCQVFVTTTTLENFQPIALEQGTVFRIEAGRWTPQGSHSPGGPSPEGPFED